MLIYKLSCGCTRQKNQMIKNKNNRFVCPEHAEGIYVSSYIYCVDCGNKRFFHSPTAGHGSVRCVKCQKKINNQAMREWRGQSKYSRKRYDTRVDRDKRAHCANRDDCLIKYSDFNNMPCKNCEKYEKKVYLRDGYETARDYNCDTRLGGLVFY